MSFEKVIKNACKPKLAPPKAKYLDPIIAATWSEDGAVHDVCKALSPRFREPNAIVVFKALIVLHTMIRNGATDNVLSYLSSSEVLRLKNVSTGQWEGYNAPENLQNYATYLNSRIRAYRELKHDAIHVQAENNRDTRLSMSLEEEARRNRSKNDSPPQKAPSRSKTISGRKLRVMTVEKGLLRETRVVQKMIDALVECRFYLDNLDDELSVTALRMLVKDLLILFQAGNEGVINVLEHYFEMSHVDAEQALSIYRHFCKQTEYVVEYLGVAKKLQNILNVPIPNLKHAPVSLVGALEEYLTDPNFEQNRIEYKTNKDAAERSLKNGTSKPSGSRTPKVPSPQPETKNSEASTSADGAKPDASKAMADFFSAIEEEQPTMFNPQTGSPTNQYFQQQATHNPFALRQQMTGAFPGQQPFVQPQMPMQTGFLQPQFTAMPNFQQQPQQHPQQHPSFSSFLQPQPTGMLQPQATGANPFRQSMMAPQPTGMSPFGLGAPSPQQQPQQFQPTGNTTPLPMQPTGFSPFPHHSVTLPNSATTPAFNAFQPNAPSTNNSPFAAQPTGNPNANIAPPARPASTPITSFGIGGAGKSASPPPQPVKTHQTGSRNPFGVPVQNVPPVPKPPTLMELAMGGGFNAIQQQQQLQQQQQTGQGGNQIQPQPTGFNSTFIPSAPSNPQQGSGMSSVATSFSFNKPSGSEDANKSPASGLPTLPGLSGLGSPLTSQNTSTTVTSGTFSDSIFSALGSQPTGATSTSNGTGSGNPSFSFTPSTLQPQATGYSAGLKAFKPTSSFGASLLESLPPIPQSAPTTPGSQPTSPVPNGNSSFNPGAAGIGSQPTGAGGMSAFGGGSGGFSSGTGVGMRPQMTGAAPGANPFRATMFAQPTGGGNGGFGGLGGFSSSPSAPAFGSNATGAGSGGQMFGQQTGMNGFGGAGTGMGASLFGGAYGQDASKQQQQPQNGSLI
ncbi:ANTH-domain-containing protein [Stereum hirsutum FP-91666 SS1]|uniref:ANTH-domain-containing protein n=1 Tax=Stereum hirsutum (strain FP-91666) TaxID=721885 RepID=R7RZU5_STEHR|nr:ANTH-domain-containing protein [Stereum hirsutum FP-91666 SS1]EIM80425.1 ANTH-domain-containing protein [Stereum hirsutum FP-91666 SS1]